MMALVRNLAPLTRVGLVAPLSEHTRRAVEQLTNGEALRRARVHPLALLAAQKTYARGAGERGKHTWTPVPAIVDALDTACYQAFQNVEPTGRRWLLALEAAGSADYHIADGSIHLFK